MGCSGAFYRVDRGARASGNEGWRGGPGLNGERKRVEPAKGLWAECK
jgi:hypothetical protein